MVRSFVYDNASDQFQVFRFSLDDVSGSSSTHGNDVTRYLESCLKPVTVESITSKINRNTKQLVHNR